MGSDRKVVLGRAGQVRNRTVAQAGALRVNVGAMVKEHAECRVVTPQYGDVDGRPSPTTMSATKRLYLYQA